MTHCIRSFDDLIFLNEIETESLSKRLVDVTDMNYKIVYIPHTFWFINNLTIPKTTNQTEFEPQWLLRHGINCNRVTFGFTVTVTTNIYLESYTQIHLRFSTWLFWVSFTQHLFAHFHLVLFHVFLFLLHFALYFCLVLFHLFFHIGCVVNYFRLFSSMLSLFLFLLWFSFILRMYSMLLFFFCCVDWFGEIRLMVFLLYLLPPPSRFGGFLC